MSRQKGRKLRGNIDLLHLYHQRSLTLSVAFFCLKQWCLFSTFLAGPRPLQERPKYLDPVTSPVLPVTSLHRYSKGVSFEVVETLFCVVESRQDKSRWAFKSNSSPMVFSSCPTRAIQFFIVSWAGTPITWLSMALELPGLILLLETVGWLRGHLPPLSWMQTEGTEPGEGKPAREGAESIYKVFVEYSW